MICSIFTERTAAQDKTCVVCFSDSQLNKQISLLKRIVRVYILPFKKFRLFLGRPRGVGKFFRESENDRNISTLRNETIDRLRNVVALKRLTIEADELRARCSVGHMSLQPVLIKPPVEANAVETFRRCLNYRVDILLHHHPPPHPPTPPLTVNRPPVSS